MSLEVRNTSKAFGKNKALHNVSLSFSAGAITAIIGPNGSGKTTLLKTILGLVIPQEGTILWKGKAVSGDYTFRKNVGYMPQLPEYPENLKVRELLAMLTKLHTGNSRDEELMDLLNYGKLENKNLGALSGGQRQRINAIIAFLFNPELLVLDEPTASLDPVSSEYFKNKLLEEKKKGKEIIITSHLMSEMEQLADRLIYLLDGKIYIDSTIEELKKSTQSERIGEALLKIITLNEKK